VAVGCCFTGFRFGNLPVLLLCRTVGTMTLSKFAPVGVRLTVLMLRCMSRLRYLVIECGARGGTDMHVNLSGLRGQPQTHRPPQRCRPITIICCLRGRGRGLAEAPVVADVHGPGAGPHEDPAPGRQGGWGKYCVCVCVCVCVWCPWVCLSRGCARACLVPRDDDIDDDDNHNAGDADADADG
jgi:hypothetical protein